LKKQAENKSVIRGVLEEELGRNIRMQAAYDEKIAGLPHGSLLLRKIGNSEYCYMKYRDHHKSISKYLGKKDNVDVE
jgi:hypothetical protein